MRPIKVVMSAFGSYAGVEVISFENFAHGIFLITGDTGSGKTTIFDAITYALYDQTSGGKREGDMMRSQYASEDTPTYVELTFSYEDKVYTVKRNPNYLRISKRRNKDGELGTTPESASVELIMPDGREYKGKIKETNNKIIEIIGLDVNQFTQIAMIAQGDFLRLLHAPSKERKEIFSKIFDTKIYGRIQDELREKAKNLSIQLINNKNSCIREMKDIRCITESPFEIQWSEMPQFTEVNSEKILELIKLIIEEIKQKEDKITEQLEKNSIQIDEVKASITKAETINGIFDEFDKAIRAKKILDDREEEFEKKKTDNLLAKKALKVWQKEDLYLKKEHELNKTLERIKTIKEELNTLTNALNGKLKDKEEKEKLFQEQNKEISPAITRIQDAMTKYLELSKKQDESESAKKAMEDAEKVLKDILNKISNNTLADIKLSVEQESLKDSTQRFLQLGQEVKDLDTKQKSLKEMSASKKRLKKITTELLKCTKSVKELLDDYNFKSTRYDELNRDFITEQVGIIAESLMKGIPCPVCGSVEHPMKAILSSKAVTQKAVDNAKADREQADKVLQSSRDEHAVNKRNYDKEYDYIEREGKRIIEENYIANDDGLALIDYILQTCSAEFDEKMKLLKEADESKKKYITNVEKQEKSRKEATSFADKKDEAVKSLQDLKSVYDNLSTELKVIKQNLPFETKKEAEENLHILQVRIKSLKEEAKKADEAHQQLMIDIGKKISAENTEDTAKQRQEKEKDICFENLNDALLQQDFVDIQSYLSCRQPESVIEDMDKEYQAYYVAYLKASENVKTYTEQTMGKIRMQVEGLKDNEKQLTNIKKTLSDESKVIFSIREGNNKAAEAISRLFKERSNRREEYEVISKLDRTANGNLSGTAKLDFQTYIQRRYFEHIIHEANKRLIVMSSNQFILQCRNLKDLGTQGEVGLDLDVYSMVTDKTRDVKTLSGGESFMASLSMALGMADVIQNTAGKIHMDTMFIDEGFGSLDDDTREEAIKILDGLAEGKRLVGIISHVTELKDRISRKLIVKKNENGSSVKWE